MKKKIVIVDYGLGNLYSVFQAFKHFGYTPVVSSSESEIINSSHLVLPGVGAFEVAINQLNNLKLISVLQRYVKSGRPLMGVCLGMQLLFEKSHEFGEHFGLGFIKGEINRFPEFYNGIKFRVPHIGWNNIYFSSKDVSVSPLREIRDQQMMYFVHSYYCTPANDNEILCKSSYNQFNFCSAIQKDNLFGFQFHPEKSGEEGLTIYKNFVNI